MCRGKVSVRLTGACSVLVVSSASLVATGVALGQTTPGTAGGSNPFEVHGLLYSGSAPLGFAPGDAWAQGESFLGVLDADGNPALDAFGVLFRASHKVDENWGNAGHGFDPTVFAGRNKNADLIGAGDTPWTWSGGGSGGPQKNDITNTYFHTRVDPLTKERWVFVAAETRSPTGDCHVDFEFNQAGIAQVGASAGQLIGLGPDGGRTVDDFMISIDFERGGQSPVANVRVWNGANFDFIDATGNAFSATNFVDIYHGAMGSWKHFADDGAETEVLTHLQLVEGGANLTGMGMKVDPCRTDAMFTVKTRSSTSWSSDLKDFVLVHFPLEPTPVVEIAGPDEICAGETFEVAARDSTGLPNSTIAWNIWGCGAMLTSSDGYTATIQSDYNCDCQIDVVATVTGGECGSTGSAQKTIIVRDRTGPALSAAPSNLVVECDAIPDPPVVSATDNCSDALVEFSETPQPGQCSAEVTLGRRWTATDACANQTAHTQSVTVQDTTFPLLFNVPDDQKAACDAIPAPPIVTATDNCSEPIVEMNEQIVPGTCVGAAASTRTWTATDSCGNQTSQSQVIAIVDEESPELHGVPVDATFECDALPAPESVTATDNCSDAAVVLNENAEPGRCQGESVVMRTWTGTDDCGNVASGVQIIALVDTTAPVLSGVPADTTVECDAIPPPVPVTAADNCSEVTVVFEESMEPGTVVGKALIRRTWTATDACGNQTTQTQLIAVVDTTAPELHGTPPDATVECSSVPVPPVVTATDNCANPTVRLTEDAEPGACDGQSTITRTWTATDDCGNEMTYVQVLSIVDRTDPSLIGVPADQTVACDAVPAPAPVTATDDCSTPNVQFSKQTQPGQCSTESTITRNWTATDDCGNSVADNQIITVVDEVAPTLSADPPDIVVECDSVPNPTQVRATDTCDRDVPVTLAVENTPGACPGEYTLHRLWSAADDCGNAVQVDQAVTVEDTTAPVISMGPSNRQFICDGRPVTFTVDATDNCSGVDLSLEDLVWITATNRDRVIITPQLDGGYSITATGPAYIRGMVHATDGCGNISDDFAFQVSAWLGREACSQGFWRNHTEHWAAAGYSPNDSFLQAFGITDLSSPEIPSGFNVNMTLLMAINSGGGSFNSTLVQGVAALLNAAHPAVDFPIREQTIKATMQAAFAGDISFDEAKARFTQWNGVERECGCPLD